MNGPQAPFDRLRVNGWEEFKKEYVQSIMDPLVAGAGGSLILRTFLFPPPLRFAEGKEGRDGEHYPADACGAIWLSFRALARLS
jgi:hypothetical protein